MAETGGPGQGSAPTTVQNAMGTVDSGYNSYHAHASLYSAPPANAGPFSHKAGGYGSSYGTHYGY